MKTKNIKNILCGIVELFSIYSLLSINTVVNAGDITVSVDNKSYKLNETFISELFIDAGENVLGAYIVDILFDKNIVCIQSVTTQFSEVSSYGNIKTANTKGRIKIAGANTHRDQPRNLVSVCKLSFKIINQSAKTTNISVIVNRDIDLIDQDQKPISYKPVNAVVKIDPIKIPSDIDGNGLVTLEDTIIGLNILTLFNEQQSLFIGADINNNRIDWAEILYSLCRLAK